MSEHLSGAKNEEFKSHILNARGKVEERTIQDLFDDHLNRLKPFCPDSRTFSIAKTHLETACFYAKKAAAQKEQNQER